MNGMDLDELKERLYEEADKTKIELLEMHPDRTHSVEAKHRNTSRKIKTSSGKLVMTTETING